MEYEIIVVCKQVYRVFVEADDDDKAQELAAQMAVDSDGVGVELLRDEVDTIIDNVYE